MPTPPSTPKTKTATSHRATSGGTPAAAPVPPTASTRIGVVESDKRPKTRKVVMSFNKVHPKYGKITQGRTVLHVHDENNDSRLGDTIEIKQCRPVSRTKRWTLVRVVERSTRVDLVQA